MTGDKLASGGKSAQFPAGSSTVTAERWAEIFGKPEKKKDKQTK